MNPVKIDVFYPIPEGWGLCNTCELMIAQADLGEAPYKRNLEEYPPELLQEFEQLSSILFNLSDHYQGNLQIRVWDPRSFQGLIKSIRHGVRRYPTFLLNGQTKFVGWDIRPLEEKIQSEMEWTESEI